MLQKKWGWLQKCSEVLTYPHPPEKKTQWLVFGYSSSCQRYRLRRFRGYTLSGSVCWKRSKTPRTPYDPKGICVERFLLERVSLESMVCSVWVVVITASCDVLCVGENVKMLWYMDKFHNRQIESGIMLRGFLCPGQIQSFGGELCFSCKVSRKNNERDERTTCYTPVN